jgi:hypothetical protein
VYSSVHQPSDECSTTAAHAPRAESIRNKSGLLYARVLICCKLRRVLIGLKKSICCYMFVIYLIQFLEILENILCGIYEVFLINKL